MLINKQSKHGTGGPTMSKEYIEREAALNCLKIARGYCPCAYKEISNLPTADVAPVVHGEWIWADDGYLRCSNCHQKAPVMTQYQDEPMTTATAYCPNCGAKMDLEG